MRCLQQLAPTRFTWHPLGAGAFDIFEFRHVEWGLSSCRVISSQVIEGIVGRVIYLEVVFHASVRKVEKTDGKSDFLR
ncbi:hypothetical protein BZG21_42620 [Escherichia coli]|nr:hypothetical protein [Escherichia coli]